MGCKNNRFLANNDHSDLKYREFFQWDGFWTKLT